LGGHLIPTIAFGVPSGVTMAILLGAFIIQGLVPGPGMLMPESRGGHLSLTFSFVWTIVIANIVTVAACFLFLNQIAKVTQVRGSLLIPPVLLLVYLGAFAEKNAFEDLYLVLFFGVLGWVMEKLHWPRPALILGLVLGPLAENRLFLATDNYGAEWLLRPWVLVLIALTLAGAFYPLWKARSRKREEPRVAHEPTAPGRAWGVLFTLAIVVVLAAALWQSRGFGFRAGLFPWAIGIPLLALAVLLLVLQLAGKEQRPAITLAGSSPAIPPDVEASRTAAILGWIAGYLGAIWLLGFTLGGTLVTFLALKAGSRERWPITLAITAGTVAFVYFVFERGLRVPFPPGQLFVWAGVA
ncbi:MAG: tripartite tricarboxylate transporter permease, partial [Burkholderiales bacterium]